MSPSEKPIPNLSDRVDRAIAENCWNPELSKLADAAIERCDVYRALEFPKQVPDYDSIDFERGVAA